MDVEICSKILFSFCILQQTVKCKKKKKKKKKSDFIGYYSVEEKVLEFESEALNSGPRS